MMYIDICGSLIILDITSNKKVAIDTNVTNIVGNTLFNGDGDRVFIFIIYQKLRELFFLRIKCDRYYDKLITITHRTQIDTTTDIIYTAIYFYRYNCYLIGSDGNIYKNNIKFTGSGYTLEINTVINNTDYIFTNANI
jgi:hypothetical protein